jgi:hypothetical protein
MDERTHHYYATHARDLVARHERAGGVVAKYLRLAFAAGDRVLDVGAGTGRDVAFLAGEGVEAYGIEPVDAMWRPSSGIRRWRRGSWRRVAKPPGAHGIGGASTACCARRCCSTSNEGSFEAAFGSARRPAAIGRLLVPVPTPPGEGEGPFREASGCVHNGVSADELDLPARARVGFRLVGRWDDDDARAGRAVVGRRCSSRWSARATARAARDRSISSRACSRDRKVATYKLALIRAADHRADAAASRAVGGGDGPCRWRRSRSGDHVLLAVARRRDVPPCSCRVTGTGRDTRSGSPGRCWR